MTETTRSNLSPADLEACPPNRNTAIIYKEGTEPDDFLKCLKEAYPDKVQTAFIEAMWQVNIAGMRGKDALELLLNGIKLPEKLASYFPSGENDGLKDFDIDNRKPSEALLSMSRGKRMEVIFACNRAVGFLRKKGREVDVERSFQVASGKIIQEQLTIEQRLLLLQGRLFYSLGKLLHGGEFDLLMKDEFRRQPPLKQEQRVMEFPAIILTEVSSCINEPYSPLKVAANYIILTGSASFLGFPPETFLHLDNANRVKCGLPFNENLR